MTTGTDMLTVGFDDLTVLSEGDLEVFVLNMSESPDIPPYYIEVAGRRFAYSATTFPIKGHGALLPPFVREHEAAGHLVLLVERGGRYYGYIHDPEAIADDEEE